jgi:hypothetical protein
VPAVSLINATGSVQTSLQFLLADFDNAVGARIDQHGAIVMAPFDIDQAATKAVERRRSAMKLIATKPKISIAQVDGSGTPETSNVRDPVLSLK